MAKHVVIIGAGPGLSNAVASIAGAEGDEITLLARNSDRLRSLTEGLAAAGVRAHWRSVDVTDHDAFRAALREVDDQAPVDVVVFQPSGPASELVDVLDATVENVRPNVELLTLGAVATAEVFAKRMIERGRGAIVFVGGGSSQLPLRFFGNLGVTMAGVRTFARSLDRALRGTGVHCGYLTLAAMISERADGSALGDDEVSVEQVAAGVWRLVKGDDSHDLMISAERAA